MKHNRRRRAALLALLLLVGLIAVPIGLTWRQVQQERLNHALIAAIDRNDTAEVRTLLRHGADPNVPILPDDSRSVWQRVRDMLRYHASPQSPTRESALLKAVEWDSNADEPVPRWKNSIDNADTVQALVEAGANVNFRGDDTVLRPFPLLTVRSFGGGKSGVAPYNPVTDPDHWKTTPLLTAAVFGKWKTLKLLLDHEAEVNATDATGYTALHYAIQRDEVDKDSILQLLRHGANPNLADSNGNTPLTLAQTSDPGIIALLKQYGARESGKRP